MTKNATIGSTFTMLTAYLPLLITAGSLPVISVSVNPFLYVLGLVTVSFTAIGAYNINRNKNFKEIFNSFNDELGENKLPNELGIVQQEEIELITEMNEVMNNIQELSVQLQKQIGYLNLFFRIYKPFTEDKEVGKGYEKVDINDKIGECSEEELILLLESQALCCDNGNVNSGKNVSYVKKRF